MGNLRHFEFYAQIFDNELKVAANLRHVGSYFTKSSPKYCFYQPILKMKQQNCINILKF